MAPTPNTTNISVLTKQRFLALLLALLVLGGCATLPKGFEKPTTTAFADTDDTALARELRAEIDAHPGQSGFLMLGSGLDAFVARAVLAHVAERSIDAQYYLFHDDLTGHLLIYELVKAAERGVRVRLLVDDMDLAGRDMSAAVLDSHPNMEVRLFNPFSRNTSRLLQLVTRFGSVTRRMHNKSFTVDNQATIIGGRNIGDEYFEADPVLSFADLDVLAIGPVVKQVSTSFDRYWNSDLAHPASVLRGKPVTAEEVREDRRRLEAYVAKQAGSVYLEALKNSDLANRIRQHRVHYYWGNAKIVADRPEKLTHGTEKTQYHLAPKLAPFFEGIQKELIIFSPYFVPGKQGAAFLAKLSRRGVRVRILTNSLASTDVGIVHAGYAKYRKRLLRAGVELYEMNKKLSRQQRKAKKSGYSGSGKASLHTKSFVFDRRDVFVGSLNLDPRAVVQNTEIGMVLESREIATQMADWFDQNIERVAFRLELQKGENGQEKILWHGLEEGKPRVFTVDPYTSFWRRLGIGFMSLLPIESQL